MVNDNLIPNYWIKIPLSDISLTSSGGTPSRSNKSYYSGTIPWVKSGELKYNTITEAEEGISPEAIANSSAKLLPKGSLLIALYGATVGRLAFLGVDAATNQAVAAIMSFAGMPNKYLYYYLFNRKEELLNKRIGGAQPNISQTILNELEIPLPPLNEQHRIVSKIEELFSELDHGVANLKKAQSQLKVYRQALLKQAFEGKLTEQWRKENKPEPAAKLLERIQAERENRYEQALKDWKAAVKAWEGAGKVGRKPGKPKAFRPLSELTVEEIESLPKIPSAWFWKKNENYLFQVKDGTHDTPEYQERGIPFVTQKNIKNNNVDFTNIRYISEDDHAKFYKRSDVEKGDIIISMIGAGRGECCIVNTNRVFSIKNVGLFKFFNRFQLNLFYLYFFKSTSGLNLILKNSKGGAQPFIGLTELRNWPLPVCSFEEQNEIANVLDLQFSVVDNLEQNIEAALQKSEALRQSILKQAFEGKLVPQDPEDEPASELLKRIQAEKAAYLSAQQQQKKRKTTKKTKSA